MDRFEREARIQELEQRSAEHRAELERRESEREADPCAMQDHLLAEHAASEAIRSSPVSQPGEIGLVYKDFDNGALDAAPTADADTDAENAKNQRDWDRWLKGHLNVERRELIDALDKDIRNLVEMLRAEWRQEIAREIGTLKNENAEIRGMLTGALTILEKRRR
jgi:hypothetical protein